MLSFVYLLVMEATLCRLKRFQLQPENAKTAEKYNCFKFLPKINLRQISMKNVIQLNVFGLDF